MKFRIVKSEEKEWNGEEVSKFRIQVLRPKKLFKKEAWVDCCVGRDGVFDCWRQTYSSLDRAEEKIKIYRFYQERKKQETVVKEYEV